MALQSVCKTQLWALIISMLLLNSKQAARFSISLLHRDDSFVLNSRTIMNIYKWQTLYKCKNAAVTPRYEESARRCCRLALKSAR